MTGVTELQKCERSKDAWLRSVQDERFGKFIEEAHAFLHGAPTMQPGSIVKGNIRCASKQCTKMSSAMAFFAQFNEQIAERTLQF